ncbi:hypothetical protein GPOL_c11100 [Gordonia polyisoprenivorans VH2]|uniref:Peptidase S1 domain-containing protein n=1 Tax=Gordonia polyisoprenivorans (strain DSM 44266 / VH2) TaxID=1112204 RepID=H6N1G1_GORPV|nr:hypothetical protein GPOL_c11100 [Gordonia polyisoprenivorans VH2]
MTTSIRDSVMVLISLSGTAIAPAPRLIASVGTELKAMLMTLEFTTRRRVRLAATSILTAALALCVSPTNAQAAPAGPTVGAGLEISTSPEPGLWGHCMLAGAGHDAVGTPLALTAGHCARLGSSIKTFDQRTTLGTVIARETFPGVGAFETNQLDYALIRLRPGVRIRPVPGSPIVATRLGEAQYGEIVCKYGDGMVFAGERCGVTGRISPVEFDAFAFSFFGDSGGPVFTDQHTLVGIVSRPSAVPFASSTTMTRVDAALTDARHKGALSGVFTPQA